MNLNDLPPTIDVTLAAEILGISRGSAYEAVRRGEIPSISVGRRRLIPTAPLMEMLGIDQQSESASQVGRDALETLRTERTDGVLSED